MSALKIPPGEIALAWLRCASPGAPRTGASAARVTVLKAVNSRKPALYFRLATNPGRAMDIGSSSGTRFASLSASSYST
jgi:hypothetical protein